MPLPAMCTHSPLLLGPTPPATLPIPAGRRPLRRRRRRYGPVMSSPSSSGAGDPLTAAARLLWGRSLPPGPLVYAARSAWSATWHLFMRQLAPSSPATGAYSRPPGAFPSVPAAYSRRRGNPATARPLHLYASLPCPWAHRVLLVRALKSLDSALPVSVAAPGPDGSWVFPSPGAAGELAPGPDKANGRRTLREVYRMRRGGYDGRATVPMLWDPEKKEVVCNESYGIIEFLNSEFSGGSEGDGGGLDLCPPELSKEIEEWNKLIYPNVNNGVYRCGFAQSQEAYDFAVNELFSTLDKLESHLSTTRYLCGDVLTFADVCLFTTLIRFDLVYNVLFKCTKRKLIEYPSLHGYTCDIYQIPKVAETCNFEAIMDGYYCTLFPLNPSSIRPVMPFVCQHEFLSKPHNRESLSSGSKHPLIHVS